MCYNLYGDIMTFEKQVEEAKRKQLLNRMTRDIIFIILGIIILITSFVYNYNKNKNNNNTNKIIKENK